ncbi:carboxyltransferase domain-containing protein [Microcella alkalica]|uniref:KipI family sensor histidine kinase inhibitor n=1 Tax=Microcella alkalica TaxID=355930 RepID=A0A839EFI3_9MICO|nr:urea amidolyase family protein [Microcella alkalica]MBA8848075.1 KipI family sensor histidine kinase inhibitor [Microcella alkalica]
MSAGGAQSAAGALAARILPCGDRALLVEVDALEQSLAAHAALAASAPDGVLELVPAARTVLVRLDPRTLGLRHAEHWLRATLAAADPAAPLPEGPVVALPVVYDGDDLEAVAAVWGCSPAGVAERHARAEWRCAFVGFAPGFPYLVPAADGGDPTAALPPVPRRATSRPAVPPGAVALAAEYTGVYPRSSPGGWQLIGRTDAVLWDARRDPPALLPPGARVRFVPVRGLAAGRPPSRAVPATTVPTAATARSITVVDPGALTLVQDLGRPGRAALGVGAAGAFDRAAHRLANRLVGNDEAAAALEVLLGGLTLDLPAGTWVAVTGGSGPVTLDGASVPPRAAVRSERDGALLHVGRIDAGLRATVAVRGGVDAPIELGSRSRDTLSGIGPDPITAGGILAIGDAIAGPVPSVDVVPVGAPADGLIDLPVRPGPRRDWFTDAAWQTLLGAEWRVSARSDRTGVRLEGPALARTAAATGRELPSEGMLPGGIQVSPDGAPTALGPDAPVTGGYPVIAVVADAGLDALAQARPGQAVRLRLVAGRP